MKKILLVAAAAVATVACSPAMFSVPGRSYAMPANTSHVRPYVEPLPTGRWDNVMRLPRGATIDVLTKDGAANIGAISGTDVDTVRVFVEGAEVRIRRADVIRVDLVDLPGSEAAAVARKAAHGALLGTGLALLASGVVGGDAWPPPGIAVRAGAALGGFSAGQVEVLRRAGRIVYLAPEARVSPGASPYR